ncbi:interferon-induced, double-stranded RNA-activated protein kinase isoform X2 [Latimeria chalumnae]|uniref:interferon-induced, double-stranded RNA-activated protein kinase isoform X2 n=1 Tax=Latimeria chalumnae TaxID=7897 RepID=UPI00313BE59E
MAQNPNGLHNYVGELLEYCLKNRLKYEFEEVSREGPSHDPVFTCRVILGDKSIRQATGKSKKEAKHNAAKYALDYLREESVPEDLNSSSAQSGFQESGAKCMAAPENRCWTPPLGHAVNCISWLNEYSQKNSKNVEYIYGECTEAPAHLKEFCCGVKIGDRHFDKATGKSKKEAKKQAAQLAYDQLQLENATQKIPGTSGTFPTPGNEPKDTSEQQPSFTERSVPKLNENPSDTFTDDFSSSAVYNFEMGNGEISSNATTNFVGRLKEYCDKYKLTTEYVQVEQSGPSHNPKFVFFVKIGEKRYPSATGKSKKEAQKKAAQLALEQMEVSPSEVTDKKSVKTVNSELSDQSNVSDMLSVYTEEDSVVSFRDEEKKGAASSDPAEGFSDAKYAKGKNAHRANRPLAPEFSLSHKRYDRISNSKEAVPEENEKDRLMKESSKRETTRFELDFEDITELDEGGYGRVFKARKKLESKYYAVKKVKFHEDAKREVTALAELEHLNIVRYYSSWTDKSFECDTQKSNTNCSSSSSGEDTSQYLYIQMELCEKGTLADWLEKPAKDKLVPLRLFYQTAKGVEYIHSKNLIHRDLKPQNIFLADEKTVKIGDFGLVTTNIIDEKPSCRTENRGTKTYMSLEQLQNKQEYDHKVDIFSLGLILFECLWVYTAMEKRKEWQNIRRGKFIPKFLEQYPEESLLIRKMLSDDAQKRPEASQIAEEIEKYLHGQTYPLKTI